MSTLVHWNCYAVLITTLCAKSAASWFRSACKGVVNSPRHRGCHKYVKTQSFHMDYFHVRCGLNFGLRWLGHMIPRYIWHIESIYTWMLYSWRADSIYIYIINSAILECPFFQLCSWTRTHLHLEYAHISCSFVFSPFGLCSGSLCTPLCSLFLLFFQAVFTY